MPISIRVSLRVPERLLSVQNVVNEIARVQRSSTAPDVQRLFRRTVVGWRTPPQFNYTQHIERNSIGVTISSAGQNSAHYALVNAGSPAHLIRPVNPGGWLRFQPGYSPSTRPRVLSSRAYMRHGAFVRSKLVHHPGFTAREFDAEIADQYTPTFQADMQAAINTGAQMP